MLVIPFNRLVQTGGVFVQTGGVLVQAGGVLVQTGGVFVQTGGVLVHQTGGRFVGTGGGGGGPGNWAQTGNGAWESRNPNEQRQTIAILFITLFVCVAICRQRLSISSADIENSRSTLNANRDGDLPRHLFPGPYECRAKRHRESPSRRLGDNPRCYWELIRGCVRLIVERRRQGSARVRFHRRLCPAGRPD
jgi:hypothetical protein